MTIFHRKPAFFEGFSGAVSTKRRLFLPEPGQLFQEIWSTFHLQRNFEDIKLRTTGTGGVWPVLLTDGCLGLWVIFKYPVTRKLDVKGDFASCFWPKGVAGLRMVEFVFRSGVSSVQTKRPGVYERKAVRFC